MYIFLKTAKNNNIILFNYIEGKRKSKIFCKKIKIFSKNC